jgi:hypothetical protein
MTLVSIKRPSSAAHSFAIEYQSEVERAATRLERAANALGAPAKKKPRKTR